MKISLVRWDSTQEGNCEGSLLPAPLKMELSPEDIVEIRFKDSLWSEEEWYQAYILDKEAIFNSMAQAGLNGKIPTFSNDLHSPLNPKQFFYTINKWDSTTVVEDPNALRSPEPILISYTAEDIEKIQFQEKISFDTLCGALLREVHFLKFIVPKMEETGMHIGEKIVFEVQLNN